MSEFSALVVCFGTVCVVFCLVLWRITSCLQATTGTRFRTEGRDRRDAFQLLERVIEWKETPLHQKTDICGLHHAERVNQVNADAVVERVISEKPRKPDKSSPAKATSEGQLAEMIGATLQ